MSREEWWLDYVEGELDVETRAEMKALLKHSKKDQDLVKDISDTKDLLQQYEEAPPAMSEDFFDGLHDKIMAEIETKEIQAKPRFRLRNHHRRWLKTSSASLLSVLALVGAFRFLSTQSLNTQWDVSQQMVKGADNKLDDISQLVSYQSEHDFLVDVASLSLDHLTKEQFEAFMKSTRTR